MKPPCLPFSSPLLLRGGLYSPVSSHLSLVTYSVELQRAPAAAALVESGDAGADVAAVVVGGAVGHQQRYEVLHRWQRLLHARRNLAVAKQLLQVAFSQRVNHPLV